jgi:glycosyltransferase involved in cell wall biosynthesis
MHDQAVENWLFRIMRDSRERYPDLHWSFYCALGKPGRLDDAIRDLGGEVLHSPVPIGNTRKFISELHNAIERGRYDVMYAHHDIVSAVYLLAAARTRVKRRIVHVHNTSMDLPTPSKVKKAIVWEPMRRVCLTLSDRIVGISRDALASMIRDSVSKPGRDVVVYYGIDTTKFRHPRRSVEATREAIGVGSSAKIVLFAGRMTAYKNPQFVIDVPAEITTAIPNTVAVFAGVGPESENVTARATDTGLADRIRVLGWRDDLPELMLASDLLLWPGQETPKEGLGLGIVEAQAAGLPIIMSRSVPEDAVVIEELASVVPLATGAEAWGREAIRRLTMEHPSRPASLEKIERSHFSLSAGTDNVIALYSNLPSR